MKQVVYQGSNKKYVMLTFDYLTDSAWDINEDRILLSNILAHNVSITTYHIDDILNNLHIYHINTKEATIDDRLYFLHTDVLVIDNLDDQTIKTTMDILNRNRNMNLCQGDFIRIVYSGEQHEMLTPHFLSYVARCNIGSTQYAFIYPSGTTRRDSKYGEWYDYYITSNSIHGQKAIGYITTDAGLDMNTWYNYLNPYGAKPKMNITISVYDNYVDAINDNEGIWLLAYGLHIKTPDYYINNPKVKLHAELYKDTLIVMDNVIGYTSIKNTLLQSDSIFRNTDVITVNQYNIKNSSNDLINYNSSRGYGVNKWMKLLLVNKNKLQNMKYNRDSYDGCYNIKLDYCMSSTKKTSLYTKISKNRQGLLGVSSYIVPFEKDGDSHIKSIEFLNRYLETDPNNRTLQEEVIQNYISYCLMNKIDASEDDVLVAWFKRATLNASTDEEKLKAAYTKLKDNLIDEYRNVKIYMEATKLTDKQPIPAVKLDKILSTNPGKIISFNWTDHQLQNIEFYRLDAPIRYTTLDINYCFRKGKGSQVMIYNGKCECKNLIDKTKNELNLDLDNIIKLDLESRKRGR